MKERWNSILGGTVVQHVELPPHSSSDPGSNLASTSVYVEFATLPVTRLDFTRVHQFLPTSQTFAG